MNVDILSLPAILALTINFSVAMSVLANQPRKTANRLIFAFILSFAVWNLGDIVIINSTTPSMARLGAHLISLGFFLGPALFLLITLHFPRPFDTALARWPTGLLIPALPLALLTLSLPDPVMTTLRVPELGDIYFHSLPSLRSWVFDSLLGVSGAYLVLGVGNLLGTYRRSRSRRERTQSLLLIVGFLGIELSAAGINVVRVLVRRPDFFFLSTGLSIAISGFFALAIWRYHLVTLQRLLHRGLVYSILAAVVLALYFLLIRHAVLALQTGFGIRSSALQALIILALVILVKPVEDNINRLIERVVSSRRKRLHQQIASLSRSLLRYSSFHEFLDRIEDSLASITGASRLGIFVREPEGGSWLLRAAGRDAHVDLPIDGPALRRIAESESVVELSELEADLPEDPAVTLLTRMGYREILPLRSDGSLLGMVALGPKADGGPYTVDELELFPLLADEVGMALSRNLALEESRAAEARLQQAEKLATMGRLVAGVAHEIRNPLNVISASAQTLRRRELTDEERLELLRFIEDETDRLAALLSDFLRLAGPRPPHPTPGRVDDLLKSVARAVAPKAEANRVEVVTTQTNARVEADFQMLEQILLNLALNGVEAMSEGGSLTLRANVGAGGWLTLQVEDTGNGIPDEVRPRITEPFFTTKADGTGLGLSIAYTLVEALGGRLHFQTGPGGTTFMVQVPIERWT